MKVRETQNVSEKSIENVDSFRIMIMLEAWHKIVLRSYVLLYRSFFLISEQSRLQKI